MKVKIEKEGKKKTYKLINSWSEVSLEMWTKIIASETGSKTKEAEEIITALSDIPKKLVKELALRDVVIIMGKIAELQSEQDTILKKVIEIGGVEYGMHPNLDDITLGEYADIESMIKEGLEKNMPNIMAVMFRKVTERSDDIYTIEAYDGDLTIRAEEMKKMSAEQVQNALVFFYHLGNAFLKTMPSVLKARVKELKKQL
jgi:hypothetical protein